MAVTITQEPSAYSPSGNPLRYTFNSDQYTQANFSFIVETYVNGAKVREERVFLERTNTAHIDISETVDALLSPPAVIEDFNSESGTTADIYIIVRENYGTPPTNQASATSTTTTAFKGEISKERFTTVDFDTDWKVQKWLTNHPTNNISVLRNQVPIASMITGSSQTIAVKFYDINDTLLHSYSSIQNFTIHQVNAGQTALLNTTGVTNFQLSQTAYFTIQIGTSDILTYTYLDDYCYNPKALLWTNEYGSFDTFVFTHNDMRKGRTEAKSFERQFGYWDGTTFDYDPLQSGTIDYIKTKTTEGSLVSGWMRQNEHDWLVELYNSTLYYLYDADGNTPEHINVTNSSWKNDQDRFEDLISEEVQYKLTNKQKSLRR